MGYGRGYDWVLETRFEVLICDLKNNMTDILIKESIEEDIFFIRGQRVMLDQDLAALYEVSTKRLNEQVRRNIERFPNDFMFPLTLEETERLRSQFATSKIGRANYKCQAQLQVVKK